MLCMYWCVQSCGCGAGEAALGCVSSWVLSSGLWSSQGEAEPPTENTPPSSGSAGTTKGMLLRVQLRHLPVFLWRSLVLSGNFSHCEVSIQASSSCLTPGPSKHCSSGSLYFSLDPTCSQQVHPNAGAHLLHHSLQTFFPISRLTFSHLNLSFSAPRCFRAHRLPSPPGCSSCSFSCHFLSLYSTHLPSWWSSCVTLTVYFTAHTSSSFQLKQ